MAYRLKLVTTELEFCVREGLPVEHAVCRSEQAASIVREHIGSKDREHFVALHLNARHHILALETVSIGSLTVSLVTPRELFKGALLNNSHAIICGHNHPSGDPEPSSDDRHIFRRLKDAGTLLGIELLDFLIVTPQRHLSFLDRGIN